MTLPLEKTLYPEQDDLPQDLPTMYDLPSEDPKEPGLPDDFHYFQPQLLRETFIPPLWPIEQIYVATDLNLYYDVHHTLRHKRPDWFAVLGVPRFYQQRELRMSYVVWQEGVNPFIVVELLSPGTEQEDLGQTLRDAKDLPGKWEVYEQYLRIPYYVIFSRYTHQYRVFQLQNNRYQEVNLGNNRMWFPELGLGLGLWTGSYQELQGQWLRWYDANLTWILTLEEKNQQQQQRAEQQQQRAEQQQQRAEQQQQRAEQEHQRAEQLTAQLRKLGIEPEI